MERYALLALFGVKVVPVPGLRRKARFIREERLALVRAGLSDDDAEESLDWLLQRASAASPLN